MTDEEFAQLFPNVKWPKTTEGKNRTYLERNDFSNLPPGFFDIPLTKDTMPPYRGGSLRNYQPTLRERFVDYLNRTLYGDNREGRDRAEFLARALDVSPAAIPNAGYETGRAVGEGRYKAAVLPGITAAAPFLGKPAKMIGNAIRPKSLADEVVEGAEGLPGRSLPGAKPVNDFAHGNVEEIVTADAKRNKIYAPPAKPQRPFEADYTKGVKPDEVDDAGNLLVDRHGKPFNPGDIIFGRRTLGGDDVGARHKDFRMLSERLMGKPIKVVPRQQLKGPAAIRYLANTNKPIGLYVADNLDLSKSRSKHIINHEGSHLADILMGRAPMPPAVENEARSVYSTLATGKENLPKLTLPTDHNYSGPEIRNELVGEVIRAALYNPNYMKTVAPKTYEWLADLFAKHPHLGVRLNSLGATTVAALWAMGQKDKSEAAETPSEEASQTSSLRGAGPLAGPFAPAKSADEPTKKSANGLIELRKALYRRGLHDQTPKNENIRNLVRALVNIDTRKKSQFYGGPR